MLKKTNLALCLAVGLAAGSAQAASIDSLTTTYPLFLWEDDNIEKQNVDLNNNKELDEGDTLRGIAEYGQFNDLSSSTTVADLSDPGRTDNHLSAIFEIEVKTKTPVIGNPLLFDYTFGPVGTANGVMITYYEQNVDDLVINNCGATMLICEGFVTNGTKILEIGFTAAETDDYWKSINSPATTDLSLLESQSTATNFGDFNFGLAVIFSTIGDYFEDQATDPIFEDQGTGNNVVQWQGGGTIKGACTEPAGADGDAVCDQTIGSRTAGFTSTSDSDVQAHRNVPEPGSLALLGLGLAGLGSLRFRRKG